MTRSATRAEQIRLAIGWQQWKLAEWLGVGQATVARIEGGQPESGPIVRLLDQLAREIGRPDLAVAEPPETPAPVSTERAPS
jgi:transcriptional regulator with XRE-family HTH domain